MRQINDKKIKPIIIIIIINSLKLKNIYRYQCMVTGKIYSIGT